MPRVSVIMACRNAAPWLDASIASLTSQDFADWELIVSDDGSDDDSVNCIRRWVDRDHRVRLLTGQQPGGAAKARNRALAASSSAYVAVLDADDLAEVGRLGQQVRRLDQDPRLGLIGSDSYEINEQGAATRRTRYPHGHAELCARLRTCGAFPPHSSMVYRRSALPAGTAFDPRFEPSEDFALWTLIARDWQLASIPQPLVRIRKHSRQLSSGQGRIRQVRAAVGILVQQELLSRGQPDPCPAGGNAEGFLRWVEQALRKNGVLDRLLGLEDFSHAARSHPWSASTAWTAVTGLAWIPTAMWERRRMHQVSRVLAEEWMASTRVAPAES